MTIVEQRWWPMTPPISQCSPESPSQMIQSSFIPTEVMPQVSSVAHTMVGWDNVSQSFHLLTKMTGMTRVLFHTLANLMARMLNTSEET